MHENTSGQWKNLGFVLQSPESGRKNNPVKIPLKIGSQGFGMRVISCSLIGKN